MNFLALFSFLVVFTSFSLAAPAPYVCPANTVVNPPVNSDKPYFYPNNWSDNQVVPQYRPDQQCNWLVNVPAGYYAKVVLQGMAQSDTYFQIIDSAKHYDMTGEAFKNVSYYYTTQFNIFLNSGNNYGPGTFAIKIVWAKLPTTTPTYYPVASGSSPSIRRVSDVSQGGVVFAETQVSIVPVAASTKNYNDLRGVLVFDGPTITSNYIGNLYHIYDSYKQFVSTGTRVFLINLNSDSNANNYFVAQDYSNTKQFTQYFGIAPNTGSEFPAVLSCRDGVAGSAAAISIYDGDEILTRGSLDDTTTLKVYSGGAKDHNLLAQYTDKNFDQSLPVTFSGVMRQYTIDTGSAVLWFTRK